MFIPRTLSSQVTQLFGWFPVVSVTGPRQSGKSTMLQQQFPELPYLNLEDPGLRALAADDPTGFIRDLGGPVIIDEVQNVPQLFSAIQVVSDERGTTGQFILSGSQNFALADNITQSLAGRVGLCHLLPLTFAEAHSHNSQLTIEDFAVTGGYPRIYSADIPPAIYYENYVRTYIDRDVSGLLKVRNIAAFRNFIALCALQAGNLINYQSLANELDVSFATVKSWVSILESSFVIFPLRAFHKNSHKTLTKTPKLYFYDTGLLCHLLGIHTTQDLALSTHKGAIIENLVVAETAKAHHHHGRTPNLQFYRDDSKVEIDLLDATGDLAAFEVKASQTFKPIFAKAFAHADIPSATHTVLYRGSHPASKDGYALQPIADYLLGLGA